MKEQMERIEIPFTYTYDQFTVFFHDDHVFVGEKDFPIGQCCVDIMNLDGASCEIGNTDFHLQPKGIFGCICKLTKLSGKTPPGKA